MIHYDTTSNPPSAQTKWNQEANHLLQPPFLIRLSIQSLVILRHQQMSAPWIRLNHLPSTGALEFNTPSIQTPEN